MSEGVRIFRDYSLFGLRVRSELALPELFPASGDGSADVVIRVGDAGARNGQPGLHVADGALVFVARDAGGYRISNGSEIVVEPNPGVPERNVRLFLLGSAFGALLHQRGLLPLHANAVNIGGKAFAFMGASGEGKSTLAAWFHDRGFQVIADDVCVIGFDSSGRPQAAPGLPRLRLWAEALEFTGRGTEGYRRSFVGEQPMDKFDVPVDRTRAARSNVPLAGLYVLERGDGFSIDALTGVEAANAVFANTYRGTFLAETGDREVHWRSAVRLAQGTPIFRATRKWDLATLDEQCARLLEHAQDS